jgi:hypothetical protein
MILIYEVINSVESALRDTDKDCLRKKVVIIETNILAS